MEQPKLQYNNVEKRVQLKIAVEFCEITNISPGAIPRKYNLTENYKFSNATSRQREKLTIAYVRQRD